MYREDRPLIYIKKRTSLLTIKSEVQDRDLLLIILGKPIINNVQIIHGPRNDILKVPYRLN